MHLILQALLLVVPLIVLVGALLVLQPNRRRSLHHAKSEFRNPGRVRAYLFFGLPLLAGVWLNSRAERVDLALYGSALLGALFLEGFFRRLVDRLVQEYLNPRAWESVEHRRDWRFEMRYEFIRQPEYVDDLTLALMREHPTLADFSDATERKQFPPGFESLLEVRAWGRALPSLQKLIAETVPTEVISHTGPLRAALQGEEAYAELRQLLTQGRDRALLMDRLQYYWVIRNLNLLREVVDRVLTVRSMAWFIGGAIAVSMVVSATLHADAAATFWQYLALSGLLWLAFVGAGASLLVVTLFRGTGAFSLPNPLRDAAYDPIWRHVVQLGIVDFLVLFVLYGMGIPFVLVPGALLHVSEIGWEFGIYSLLSCGLCLVIFAYHVNGTHEMMSASKRNALDRVDAQLVTATDEDRSELLEYQRELRGLNEWPFAGVVVSQSLVGVLGPIAAQVTLLAKAFVSR